MKRLGVFAFFNKEGYVEEYVDYLLKEMTKNLDNLYIMVIGLLDDRGKKILSKYSNNIAYRENKGFTGGAWQDSIINQITFEELAKYDEVVFFNDIFYGPIYPMEKVFVEMDKKKDLDFWGITRHYETKDFTGTYENGIIPEHIQTYFYAVRNRMLKSNEFKRFWLEMPEIKTPKDDIAYQETRFTNYFSNYGYKWDTYVNMETLKGEDLNNYCMNYEIPYTLISKYNMPFIRRKSLIQIIENSVSGPEIEAKRVLDYIENETNYNVDYIWDDLLRNNNIYGLYTKLHLNYIVPTDRKLDENNNKVALISNIELNNKKYDLYLLNKTKLSEIINKYDYICYIDYDKISDNLLVNNSNKELLIDNTIFNDNYIDNVLYLFNKNKKLAYLGAPEFISNLSWQSLSKNWDRVVFDKVVNELKELNINVNISYEKAPITKSKAFWLKTEAIKDINIDKLSYIHLELPYILQSNGYYSGLIYSKEYASVYLTALTEEYKRYTNTHPYAAVDSIPLSKLFKGIFIKIRRKIFKK